MELEGASMVPKAKMKLETNPSVILGDAVVLHLHALMRSTAIFQLSPENLRKRFIFSKMYRLYRLYRPYLESLGSGQHAAASGQLFVSRQKILDDLKSWNVGNAHL